MHNTLSNLSQEEAKELLELLETESNWTTTDDIRDRVFSTLTVGSSVFEPYWFSDSTAYSQNIWYQKIDDGNGGFYERTIDFNIRLHDGKYLTHRKHRKLLSFIKHTIAIQIHPRYNGSEFKPSYAHSQLAIVLYALDWLILNSERLHILELGMLLMSDNDFKYFLTTVSDLPVSEGIYKLTSKTENYIKENIASIDEEDFQNVLHTMPELSELPPDELRQLHLTDDELIRGRFLFWKRGWYYRQHGALTFKTPRLLADLYQNTLQGASQIPRRITDLDMGIESYRTEFESVEVRSGYSEGLSIRNLKSYIGTLRKMTIFEDEDFYIDRKAIFALTVPGVVARGRVKPEGRYKTVPIDVISVALRKCVEFVINETDNILDMMLHTLKTYQETKSSTEGIYLRYQHIRHTFKAGVLPARWSLERSEVEFYADMRRGVSLCELYQILLGAIGICTCGLVARRSIELLNLESKWCLVPRDNPQLAKHQAIQYKLRFHGAKTGAAAKRQVLQRPIPRVLAKAIYKLKTFNRKLEKLNLVNPSPKLLVGISRLSGKSQSLSKAGLYNYMALAADYFEFPTIVGPDKVTRRYYIRPHQLRRFFAMLFFYAASPEKLWAICWMLGHTDLHSFYRYVTEVTGGRAMNEAKANVLRKAVANEDAPQVEQLEKLVEKLRDDYETKQVFVRTSSDLTDDLKYLSEENFISLEPTFEEYLRGETVEHDILDYLKSGEIEFQPKFFDIKNEKGEIIHRFTLVLTVHELEI
ncbi:hypothetical protein ACIQAL_03805 [Pseudomonas sp. NPDC088368]|uniref:hypothetical protein n=1 Tax=Pseudomonas sp. NPDC088368 TaxID=3364453 RepID=UPI00381BE9D7